MTAPGHLRTSRMMLGLRGNGMEKAADEERLSLRPFVTADATAANALADPLVRVLLLAVDVNAMGLPAHVVSPFVSDRTTANASRSR